MIVEFYGLPGSGKTTHMQLLREQFPSQTATLCVCKRLVTGGHLKYILRGEFIAFACGLLRLWLAKRKKESYDFRAIYGCLKLYVQFMELRQAGDPVLHLSDHGLVQCISSVVWDDERLVRRAEPLLRKIQKRFAGSVRMIYTCNENIAQLYERIVHRQYEVRLKHYSEADAFRVMENQKKLFRMADEIFNAGGATLRVDSEEDLDANFQKICQFLEL